MTENGKSIKSNFKCSFSFVVQLQIYSKPVETNFNFEKKKFSIRLLSNRADHHFVTWFEQRKREKESFSLDFNLGNLKVKCVFLLLKTKIDKRQTNQELQLFAISFWFVRKFKQTNKLLKKRPNSFLIQKKAWRFERKLIW